ncbi:hypothetical protein [Microbacterium enclense]|uniref:hypothetical protein n=1 Tax=Microbacterium enclense TaxID=993073 RepID=UPI003F7FDAD6
MSDEIVPYTGVDAIQTREAVVAARTELTRRRVELQKQQEAARQELERKRKELEAEFERQRAELAAQMAPLREQLAKMQEVMWTVDLYLGRDETLQLVRDGQSAPADTPITVRQKVLVMAEESLILMDRQHGYGGMNAEHIDEFISWLAADDEHLNRVLPEQKGVVVLIPTRVQSDASNDFERVARNAQNQQSYWLLRNGQKLYVLTVDPELVIRNRVLPRRREFVEVFEQRLFGFGGTFGEPVRPGSDEWFELKKRADARRRHYMRVMLVLQGVLDRTPVWHPLPASGASFMSIADQDAGRIVLLQDDEHSIQLGEGGETFAQWQRRLNGLLRPGLRVIGNWGVRDFRDMYEEGGRWARGYHPRIHTGNAEYPDANVPHLIEGRRDGGFVIRYERTDKVFKRNQPVPDRPGYVYRGETAVDAKQRASCVVMPDDDWVLPFDLVTVPELERFLYSREERSKHFLTMVPTVRAALQAKLDEAAQEADFRGLLGQLLVAEGADAEGIELLVDELVHWYKLAYTWTRPLNGDGPHEKKAADKIVAEYRARRAADADDAEERIVTAGRQVPGAIAVARDRQGRWFAYAPSSPALEPGIHLDVTRIYRDGRLGEPERWKVLATRTASALHVAWQNPEWSSWTFGANPRHYLTGSERMALVDRVRERTKGTPAAVTEFFDPQQPDRRGIFVYSWADEEHPDPASAPTVEDSDVFYWRNRRSPVAYRGWVIDRDDAGVPVLGEDARGRFSDRVPTSFSNYAGGSRWGETPWWPDDARDYGEARPRLIWADESVLDGMADYRRRCAQAAEARRQQKREREAEAQEYVPGILDLIRGRQIGAVRARFEQDYGRDADDLWDGHLKSLGLTDPIHSRDLWGIVAIALDHGEQVVGRTLRDLADSALAHGMDAPGEWHPRSTGVDVGVYGDIIVPMPGEEARC